MAARVSGCTTIIAVDLNEDRLKLALDLGATHTLSGKDSELKEKLIQLSGGGLEYAIDTTGNPIVRFDYAPASHAMI
jgi:aryl-alcohol dehydrogenase